MTTDVIILGGGFGGTLTALLLQKIGLRAVVLERGCHPRFSLGESSTPQADLILDRLATVYDLPRIRPLVAWGPWQRAYPELPCGLKRGFSYAHHRPEEKFTRDAEHRTELMVASSVGDEDADTHWHRATFDQFLFEEARAAGILCLDQFTLQELTHVSEGRWQVIGQRLEEAIRVEARFVIDASGDGQVLPRWLNAPPDTDLLQTRSRCLFAHFRNLRRWEDVIDGDGRPELKDGWPYRVDDAALHHVFPGGWMYVLPFNTGVTSAGFCLDLERFPIPEDLSPADEWAAMLRRFPSIGEQFVDVEVVDPPGGIRRTGRLQRLVRQAAGSDWALLPTTAGIIDALHSTGNAHTLSGIERLIEILEQDWGRPSFETSLDAYSRQVHTEVRMIDAIVSGCYATFERFELFTSFAMFYFAGATFAEHRRRDGDPHARRGYLCADLPEFLAALDEGGRLLRQTLADAQPAAVARFQGEIARLLEPFNVAGLCDPAKRNLYPFA